MMRDELAARYVLDLTVWPEPMRARFCQLAPDEATDAYLARVTAGRHGHVRTFLHRTLRKLWSDFDVNGVLGMYPMHLLSTDQLRALLGPAPITRALDVGAGSGEVTEALRPLCAAIEATETSAPMARRLRERGIPCHELDLASPSPPLGPFDLITCLNVLDRCARPLSLLQRVVRELSPSGRLVVALALPYRPFYYVGARTPEPEQRLSCTSERFEAAARELMDELAGLGLTVRAFTRVPYLSCGDAHSALYVLDDVVLVLERTPGRTP